jgi:integrase
MMMSDAPLEPHGVHFRTRLRYGKGLRQRFVIALSDASKAQLRANKLQELANALSRAGKVAEAPVLLKRGGEVQSERDFADVLKVADELCRSQGKVSKLVAKPVTFRELAEQWTSGALNRKWPDHVRTKRSVENDVGRLEKLYPSLGSIALPEFTLEDAERAMASLPAGLSAASRRHYGQLISKVLKLAVYPCRLIERSPLPTGFLPTVKRTKAFSFLYPSEYSQLMACTSVPLARRVVYGFLASEGMRLGEAAELRWTDVDLERGAIRLDKNKTDDARAWALDPGVTRGLAAWRKLSQGEFVFGAITDHFAGLFRADLQEANVARSELFERSATRVPIRVHDLRATFVTVALASGRTEAWVADRTGHKSSQMIAKYRRGARTVAELGLGVLAPLADSIPEFAKAAPDALAGPAGGPQGGPGIMQQDNAASANSLESKGAPGRIRTCDPRIRKADTAFPNAQPSANTATSADGKAPETTLRPTQTSSFGPGGGPELPVQNNDDLDPVEVALAAALELAAKATQWEVVTTLGRELSARRLARSAPKVASLETERTRRERGGS